MSSAVAAAVFSAEAADQLGTNVKLVERLVEWCEAKDHAGVMGESNRLLSALIRHSKSKVGPVWPGGALGGRPGKCQLWISTPLGTYCFLSVVYYLPVSSGIVKVLLS